MQRSITVVILLLGISLLFTGCGDVQYEVSKQQRAALAEENRYNPDVDIVIGVAWPFDRHSYLRGARLAGDEINAKGGLNGRKVRLVFKDESVYRQAAGLGTNRITRSSAQEAAVAVAREFAADSNVVAVVGHQGSAAAVPAATAYNYHGILYIASTSTSPTLTVAGGQTTFQLLPDDREMVRQVAGYAAFPGYNNKISYERIVILNERTKYGNDIASFFDEAANEFNLRIISRASFFRGTVEKRLDYRSVLFPLRSLEFDAIFLIASREDAGRIIAQAREIGLKQPFLGMDTMEHAEFLRITGKKAAEGTVVPSSFNENFNLAQPFIQNFRQIYGQNPDTWAALAYDSIYLVAHGITLSHYSTVPVVVANSIRYMDTWFGVTGAYRFKLDGTNLGRAYIMKAVKEGEFRSLPGGHVPYMLHRHKQRQRLERHRSAVEDGMRSAASQTTTTPSVATIVPTLPDPPAPEQTAAALLELADEEVAETVGLLDALGHASSRGSLRIGVEEKYGESHIKLPSPPLRGSGELPPHSLSNYRLQQLQELQKESQ
ncbi:ABC transporter substrate-binding protein [Thioflexithrix psekupsensis]|uniref:Leucine-binding protein domain-containing protein n=1 Tax=Thioflexithrix psekupsensis TaxID=1570016 RepID=A0A251X9Y0_9GAMM|nr:ABC transporter substrate-binding protein [Thioflexithrix psekupsensis]OUD14989.1 hypothetical protein TPSD3_04615 [Thioflexithrix psekupsensis]